MQTLDRLDWTAGVAFAGDGVRVGIRCNDASALERIHVCIPPTWRRTSEPGVDHLYSLLVRQEDSGPNIPRAHHLFVDADRRSSSRNLDEVLDALEACLHFQAA